MQIAVLTSDPHIWAVKPFAWLFEKYWGHDIPVKVVGYTPPDFPLPDAWQFVSLGDGMKYPVGEWSTGLGRYLQQETDDQVLLMLEDFWLSRPVDVNAIGWLSDWLDRNGDVVRLDLTSDRLYAVGSFDVGSVHRLDLIQGDPSVHYHFSYQAAIWDRKKLLTLIRPHETPWVSELEGTTRLRLQSPAWRVIGTRQWPLRYVIAVRRGVADTNASWTFPPRHLSSEDVAQLQHEHLLEHA